MKMKMKKTILILLGTLLAASFLSACSTDPAPEQQPAEPNATRTVLPVPYDKDTFLADGEFVVLNQIQLGMTYEEVAVLLGGDADDDPDLTALNDGPPVKGLKKDGYLFGFYAISDEYYSADSLPELKRDGAFYLLRVLIAAPENVTDALIRDIRIGDSIEAVLAKFPAQDRTPRQWAYQIIYGVQADELAVLSYETGRARYAFIVTAATHTLVISFDQENRVEAVKLRREDNNIPPPKS